MRLFKRPTKSKKSLGTIDIVQITDITPATRIAFWNLIFELKQALEKNFAWTEESTWHKEVWKKEFEAPLHLLNQNSFYNQAYAMMINQATPLSKIQSFFSESYAALPVRAWTTSGKTYREMIGVELNTILIRYSVAFRFKDGFWVQVGSEIENQLVQDVLLGIGSYPGTEEKVQLALRELSNPDSANYGAAVADAINSVEAFVRHLTGAKTLPKSIDWMNAHGSPIHPALLESLEKLYAWTSAADNQRHGSANASDLDRDLAKFTIMTMFAWLNLLLSADSSSRTPGKPKA